MRAPYRSTLAPLLAALTASACGTGPATSPPPAARAAMASSGSAPPAPSGDRERHLLSVGARAPDFRVPDQGGAERTLTEYRGGPVVLYFYPRDATPGCTAEACGFRDAWDRLADKGVTVLGVSRDGVESHRRFAQEHELPFPILADVEGAVTARYGVSTTDGKAARVTFLIDGAGRVAEVFPKVDPAVHAAEVLSALEALGASDGARARIDAAVAADDRSDGDRALDTGRRPAETLAFFGIREGMRLGEIFAGSGYTTELLARVVGPSGKVYAHNNRFVLERFAEKPWSARLGKEVMAPVVRVDRELADPLGPDAKDLDAVLFILAYHDTVWMNADRSAMNRAVFAALSPGGIYGIVDHHASRGHGTRDAKTLHRIERDVVVREVTAAGFTLEEEALFLRNTDDARDWSASPGGAGKRRGTSDRFVLLFKKP